MPGTGRNSGFDDMTSLYVVEIRKLHQVGDKNTMVSDLWYVASSLRRAEDWIASAVKSGMIDKEFRGYKYWYAISTEVLDQSINNLGLCCSLIETYDHTGKTMHGEQPV